MIMVFANRNRDIKVDIVEYYCIDDSESDSANPSQESDQDQPEGPDDRDMADHDENEQDPDDVENNHEGSPNGQGDEPHESPAEGSTESDGIGDYSSSEEETGSERDHEDSTNSGCSANKIKSILKRKSEQQIVDVPINAHLGEKH